MSVVFHQLSDGVDGGQIEVAFDAVFERAGRGGKINQLVGVHPMNYSVYQSRAKCVAGADRINGMKRIDLRIPYRSVPDNGLSGSVVVETGNRGDYGTRIILLKKFNLTVKTGNGIFFGHVGAENFGFFFVDDQNVDIPAELPHYRRRFFHVPQFGTVVDVAADREAVFFCRFAGRQADAGQRRAQSGRDAAEVEPVGAVEYFAPVEVLGTGLRHCAVGAVIGTDRGTGRKAFFQNIHSDTAAAAGNERGVNAVTAQSVQRGLSDDVVGQFADIDRIQSVAGKGNGHVCLAAAERFFAGGRLFETKVIRRRQTQQDFSESNDFFVHKQIIFDDIINVNYKSECRVCSTENVRCLDKNGGKIGRGQKFGVDFLFVLLYKQADFVLIYRFILSKITLYKFSNCLIS